MTERPSLQHHSTTPPALVAPLVPSSAHVSGELLRQVQNRLNELYRDVKFDVSHRAGHDSFSRKHYQKRVSFDTINIEYFDEYSSSDDDDFSYNDDYYGGHIKGRNRVVDDYDFRLDSSNRLPVRGRGYDRSPSPNRRARSPMGSPNTSPNRRVMSPMGGFLSLGRPEYPTRPIITHRGCTFSKVHRQYEDLYLRKLYNKENGWLKPVLPLRVILVYINGRKHTWVALDWILNNFIEHGDSIIVISAINHDLSKRRQNTSNYNSASGEAPAFTPKQRMRKRNSPAYVKHIAKHIMSYIMEVINKDVIAKVSIEIVEGKSKNVLREMYKLYEPNLVCTGTKQNTRISAPLKSWNSSKLSDRLVKNFPLPVIVVPSMNMINFEQELQTEINSRYPNEESTSLSSASRSTSQSTSMGFSSSSNSKFSKFSNTNQTQDEKYDSSDSSSINSDSSVGSDLSGNSYSSYDEIAKLYKNYKQTVKDLLATSAEQEIDDKYFSNKLVCISDLSSDFCRDVRSVDPDFRGKGAKLARAITGSNSFGKVPYKTKSLLDPHPKSSTSSSSGLSYKEMKKNLMMNAQKAKEASTPPTIEIDAYRTPSPVNDEPPRQSALKFVDPPKIPVEGLKSSSDGSTDELAKRKKKKRSTILTKSLSHDIESSSARPNLEPSKSQPDISVVLDDDKKSKKSKKKRWLGLFK